MCLPTWRHHRKTCGLSSKPQRTRLKNIYSGIFSNRTDTCTLVLHVHKWSVTSVEFLFEASSLEHYASAKRRKYSSMWQSREWVDGSWVMGQMGRENRMGHMGHGSLGVDPWPISFLTPWLGNDNISCQSVMHVQLCMWLTKFQVHVHIQVHASRAAAGTQVPVPGYPVPG